MTYRKININFKGTLDNAEIKRNINIVVQMYVHN